MANSMVHYRYIDERHDYTFRFYPSGKVSILDNATNTTIRPKELSGPSLEFYALKNIQWIKTRLQSAGQAAG